MIPSSLMLPSEEFERMGSLVVGIVVFESEWREMFSPSSVLTFPTSTSHISSIVKPRAVTFEKKDERMDRPV